MAKIKTPLLSFNARGTISKAITFVNRRLTNIAEKKPEVPDAHSLAQLSWRHMYQKAVALWHALSVAEQQDWESQARRRHMTGFAWFMSQALKPNPGLYLPLQGGTMSGDIHMDSHVIDGLPAPLVASEAARKAYIDTHINSLTPHLAEILPGLLAGGNLLFIPTNAGWTEAVVGSGASGHEVSMLWVGTGVVINSSARRHASLLGFRIGSNFWRLDWDKKLYAIFNYARSTGHIEILARFQIKETTALGALAAKGIGLRADNLALKGESYGTALGVVDLSTNLASNEGAQIKIIHYPASKIEWYVNGVLKATQTTLNTIPSGVAGGTSSLVHSIKNGPIGGWNAQSRLLHPKIWQEL